MIVLLSPAKSMDFDFPTPAIPTTIPVFADEADYLAKKLQKMSAEKIGELMHISTALADLNYDRYQNWEKPTAASDLNFACALAFSGEVYKGLDLKSLNKSELKIAQSKIRILSGLYGVLKPLDVIYPYRLEMGTKWEITAKTKNLYAYWKEKSTPLLNQEIQDANSEFIVNLASTEYFKSIDTKNLNANIITPVFKDYKNGKLKIIMLYAKHARGTMARYIVQNNVKEVEQLKLYDIDGYRFSENDSSEKEWVFTR
jgi:cytoplasmic iron level regulating protein YaaA (DUF328/UPF0246 family)